MSSPRERVESRSVLAGAECRLQLSGRSRGAGATGAGVQIVVAARVVELHEMGAVQGAAVRVGVGIGVAQSVGKWREGGVKWMGVDGLHIVALAGLMVMGVRCLHPAGLAEEDVVDHAAQLLAGIGCL